MGRRCSHGCVKGQRLTCFPCAGTTPPVARLILLSVRMRQIVLCPHGMCVPKMNIDEFTSAWLHVPVVMCRWRRLRGGV